MDIKVPFLDLRITDEQEMDELLQATETVFRHGKLVMGPEVAELESAVASFTGRSFAVGVGSGTDALFFALKSLGIGPGDEVITTSLSWIATANAIAMTGATPVFADIEEDLNISPASVERLITPRSKAIIPVHYTGRVCQMHLLCRIAEKHGLALIEDASQAFSARYGGKMAGAFGTVACFSLNPMKVFPACGEAGIVLTDSEEIRDRLTILRYNGTVNKEVCIQPSLNGRIDTLQAALLLKRLPRVARIVERRRQVASAYSHRLTHLVKVPLENAEERNVYYTYTIRTPRREELMEFLSGRGIETKIQYTTLMPEQPAYRDVGLGEYGCARKATGEILCLPCHEKLTDAQIDHVVTAVESFFGNRP